MKRLLVLALLALGLTIVAVPTATPAAPGDAKGPPCANITNGEGGYSLTGVVDFTVFLQAPTCSFVTYSFVVTDTAGNEIATLSPDDQCTPETTDGGCVHYSVDLGESGPSPICIYTTTSIGNHLVDRAPNSSDASCPTLSSAISLARGQAAAAGGFD
jgi:hypothetical protein